MQKSTSGTSRRDALRLGAGLAVTSMFGVNCSSMQRGGSASTTQQANRQPLRIFDVRDYGAIGDGATLDTASIQRAIDEAAASAASGSSVQVLLRGKKKYLVGAMQLKGGIDFHLADDAELLVSTNQGDYAAIGGRGGRGGATTAPTGAAPATQAGRGGRGGRGGGAGGGGTGGIFTANEAHGLRITGTGIVNGRSPEFMDHYDTENEWWRPKPFRPRLLQITGCKDFEIHDVTLKQAPSWTLHLVGCQHTLVDKIKILNQLDVPNCDGIDPDHCQDLEIRGCHIVCGDDAIVIKTGRGGSQYGPSTRIRVKDCILETQDSGLKIGTETTQDIFDVVFERCEVRTGCRGICIQLRDEGNVYNVEFRDIKFTSRYFSAPWWGRGEGISFTALPRTPDTQVGTIHDIRVKNVTGRAENSLRIGGAPNARVRDVSFENVAVTLDRWTNYPGGVFDNRPPELNNIETHGNPGIHIRNADNITIKDCKVDWGKNRPDYFTHALQAENVTGLKLVNFKGEAAHPEKYKAISIEEAAKA